MDSKWTQIGGDIKGKAKYDSLGQKIEISDDGSTIALGTSSGKGSLIVYRNINNSWTEVMKMEGKRGGEEGGSIGYYFSLSADGSTIATGDPYDPDPDIDNKGKVQVFNVPDPYAPTLLSSSPSDTATN